MRLLRVGAGVVIGALYGAAFVGFLGLEPMIGAPIGALVMAVVMWRA